MRSLTFRMSLVQRHVPTLIGFGLTAFAAETAYGCTSFGPAIIVHIGSELLLLSNAEGVDGTVAGALAVLTVIDFSMAKSERDADDVEQHRANANSRPEKPFPCKASYSHICDHERLTIHVSALKRCENLRAYRGVDEENDKNHPFQRAGAS